MNRSDDDGFLSRWSRRKTALRRGEPLEEPTPGARERTPAEAVPFQAKPPAATSTALPASALQAPTTAAPVVPVEPAASTLPAEEPPPLTLDDVAQLRRDSDFSPFVKQGVDESVRNAAVKKLFSDPHFNVMDGLDIYIDDYSKPDPLPASMLRKMAQAAFLGLVDPPAAPGAAPGAAESAESGLADPEAATHAQDATPGDSRDMAAGAPATASHDADTPAPGSPEPTANDEPTAHEDTAVQLQPDPATGSADDPPRPAGPAPGLG